jgi:hypothetical protein
VYYWVPANALILFGATGTFQLVLRRWPRSGLALGCVLPFLLVGNVVSIPAHYRAYVYPGSSWKWHERADELLACVGDLRVDQPIRGLNDWEAALCRSIRERFQRGDAAGS